MKLSSRFGAYGPNHRNARRAERSSRRFWPGLGLERMEERTLLSISSTITTPVTGPAVVTMTGDSAVDTLVLSKSSTLLQHNTLTAPSGQGYADNLDFDSSTPTVSDHVTDGTDPVIINGGGNDQISIGDPTTPASSFTTAFTVNGTAGGHDALTIDDSADTTAQQITIALTGNSATAGTVSFQGGPTISFSNVASLSILAGNGNDTINVSSVSQGTAFSINTGQGTDTVNVAAAGMREASSFSVVGGGGADTLNINAALQPETAMSGSSVTILGSPPINFTSVGQVNVQNLADGTLVPTSSNPQTLTSVAVSNVVLGEFTDDDPNSTASGFQVVVDWGDTSQSLGSVQRINGAGSPYEVLGSHTYAKPGVYKVNASVLDLGSSVTTTLGGVTITNSDNGGFGLQIPGTITLNVATYQTAAFNITGLANQSISAALGAFAYSNPANTNPTFTASINWGDNTPATPGTLAVQPDGAYIVTGTHTYAQGNTAGQPSYAVTVTITDNEDNSAQFVTSATVAQNLTVTTTADSGPGSLRNVIDSLNSSGQAGPITFDIPGAGVHTIYLLSPLPTIQEPVLIDGSSQPGFSGSPLIELSGGAIQPSVFGAVYGLQLAGGTSLVRNLAINGFGSAGVVLKGPGGDVLVSDYIGTNPQGTAAVPNGEGILVQGSSGNVIASNLISGNSYAGIELFNNATIQGSGYDPTAVAVHNAIVSNVIGTDLTSSRAVPNGVGILVNDASFNLIGGLTPASGNVISGNTSYGVQLLGEHATGNVLLANIIGTDRSHTRNLGNGIGVYQYAQIGNVIDQSTSATGNVIVFNSTNVLTRSLSQGPQVERALVIPGASSTIAGFSIIYSTYVDPTRASSPANFILNQVLGKNQLGPAIPLTATYTEQFRLTQLVLNSPVPIAGTYQLTIVGTSPGGVTDRVGIFLAGNPKAVRTPAGSNFVATYTNGVQVS